MSLQSSRASLSSSESHCRPSPRSPPITFPDEIEVGEQRIPCEKRLRSWVWYSRASAQWSALHRRARALHRRITQALGQRGSHNKVGLRRRCCWWVLVVFGNRRLHKAAREGRACTGRHAKAGAASADPAPDGQLAAGASAHARCARSFGTLQQHIVCDLLPILSDLTAVMEDDLRTRAGTLPESWRLFSVCQPGHIDDGTN